MSASVATSSSGWYPVATTYDALPRSTYRTSLLGRELVVWRADDGFVNVWENRCLHRGVRLSIGSNDGAELVCRYHGWRYANRSAGCTYIPAHPADSPARTITNTTYPSVERYGLVWTGDDPVGEVPQVGALTGEVLCLRSLPVRAPQSVVEARLGSYTVDTASEQASDQHVVFFVQPVDEVNCVVRPVLAGAVSDEMSTLRAHAAALGRLIREIEAEPFDLPEAMPVALETPVVLPSVNTAPGRTAPLTVQVTRKWDAATDVVAIELSSVADATLPTAQPGAHIDVHLPNELIRQYSLTNRPGEATYRIAVKRDPNSRGGSASLHDEIEVGDVLQISEPRNGFPLRRNIPKTLLVAGGIGVTPLVAMAHALDAMELDFELHYFVASEGDMAFRNEVAAFGERFIPHVGMDPEATSSHLANLVANPNNATQVYACGPPPMLDALRTIAADAGWPSDAVRFEYFKNTNDIDDSSSFTVELARSALTVEVSEGQSILEVLREHDVAIPSSCEQGACGTCAATVIEGDPLHQDVYLTPSERDASMTILTCVSRATSDRLVLDL